MACIWYSRNSWGNFRGYVDFLPPNRIFSHGLLYKEMRNMPPGSPRHTSPSLPDWQMARN